MRIGITIALVVAAVLPQRLAAQAVLTIPEGTTFSFGRIVRGNTVEKIVNIKNTGKDTLHITNVEPSCGCTGAMLSSSSLPPGSSGTLQIKFNSTNFHGDINKSVIIHSDAPGSSGVRIDFSGTVIQEVVVDPEFLTFQHAVVGIPDTLKVTVRNEGSRNLLLLGYSVDLPGVALMLPTAPIPPNGSREILVVLKAVNGDPLASGRLILRTDHPTQQSVPVSVFATVSKGPEKDAPSTH